MLGKYFVVELLLVSSWLDLDMFLGLLDWSSVGWNLNLDYFVYIVKFFMWENYILILYDCLFFEKYFY